MAREEKKLETCLLAQESTKLVSPTGAVLLCGLCTNRSDMVGNLGTACVVSKK